MQPITFRIPRAFMVLIMFLVPSDIMVVGPGNVMTSQDYKLRKLFYAIFLPKYLNKAIFSLGKCTVVCTVMKKSVSWI